MIINLHYTEAIYKDPITKYETKGWLFCRKSNTIYQRFVYVGSKLIGRIDIVNSEMKSNPREQGLYFRYTNQIPIRISKWIWDNKGTNGSINYCSRKVRTLLEEYLKRAITRYNIELSELRKTLQTKITEYKTTSRFNLKTRKRNLNQQSWIINQLKAKFGVFA